MLPHEVAALRRRAGRPRLSWPTGRSCRPWPARFRRRYGPHRLVAAGASLRWHHRVVNTEVGLPRRGCARPPPAGRRPPETAALLTERSARDNGGYERIHGGLKQLGHRVGGPAIRRILKRTGPGRHPAEPKIGGVTSPCTCREPAYG
jgi:putative transposase